MRKGDYVKISDSFAHDGHYRVTKDSFAHDGHYRITKVRSLKWYEYIILFLWKVKILR